MELISKIKKIQEWCSSKIHKMWKSIKDNMPSWIQAIATVVLVCWTISYVKHSGEQVNIQSELLDKKDIEIGIQREQFTLVNRAKIYPKLPKRIEGKLDKGTILFENTGNFPAKDFKLIWKIIVYKEGEVVRIYPPRSEKNILSQDGKEKRNREEVAPEEILGIPYSSDFKNDDKVVFIVIAWRYEGKGIDNYMLKDMAYLWNTDKETPEWGLPYWLDYDHVIAIDSVKSELKKYLEQEEND